MCAVIRRAFFHYRLWFFRFNLFAQVCLIRKGKKMSAKYFIRNGGEKLVEKIKMKRMWLLFVCTNICVSKKLFATAKITDWFSEMYNSVYEFHLLLSWSTNPSKFGEMQYIWFVLLYLNSCLPFHVRRSIPYMYDVRCTYTLCKIVVNQNCVCRVHTIFSLNVFFFWPAK